MHSTKSFRNSRGGLATGYQQCLLILLVSMYLFGFSTGMRKAGSNLYRDDLEEMRMAEVRMGNWTSALKVYWQVQSDSAKQKYASQK